MQAYAKVIPHPPPPPQRSPIDNTNHRIQATPVVIRYN